VTYHDVVAGAKGVWFDTRLSEFRAQLDAMEAAGARFVSLAELDARLTAGADLPPRSVLVTFSDGYRGVYEWAWPELKRRRIPFVVFMHTGHVGSEQGRPKMTWEMLRELDGSGLGRIESQTVSHPSDLTQMSDGDVRAEFAGSKAALERGLGRPVTALAYPNGNFDGRVARLAREAGYRLAFTEELVRAESSPDLWRIGRFLHTKVRLD
jgi:peptidoglycan/xylan/chitin deacetylase (PgdA/CDA1 family)